uniref:Rieske (2Fe-2S) protein n=1 Tax=Pseudonocardia dioxanivorans TaxID=240495 RepID=UPI0015E8714F|nr:Rieske (2Fe-2S) protein [Pseudonocardia dioxanivorans]
MFGADELAPGEMRAVQYGAMSVVVLRDRHGRYHALRNACLHQGAPLSKGTLGPMVDGSAVGQYEPAADREVLRCPWHGYEFDVESGRCPADPARLRLRTYPVAVEDGQVVLGRDTVPGGQGKL